MMKRASSIALRLAAVLFGLGEPAMAASEPEPQVFFSMPLKHADSAVVANIAGHCTPERSRLHCSLVRLSVEVPTPPADAGAELDKLVAEAGRPGGSPGIREFCKDPAEFAKAATNPALSPRRRAWVVRYLDLMKRLEVTKSGRRREVPMRQAVYDLLAARPGPREGRLWPARKIRTAFESAVTAASLEDFRFHDCRHHFASWFMMRGGSLQALKELLGHQDIKTTLIYAHLSPAHLRAEVAKTERPAMPVPTPDGVSTKSAHSVSAAVESEEGIR